MENRIIPQPLRHDGNPSNLGEELLALLNGQDTFTHIWVISAWVASNTLLRFKSAFKYQKAHGAHIHLYCGIDFQGTSKEALELANELDVDSRVLFNLHPSSTFHPKVYIFETHHVAHLFVGSNNFTEAGLFSNYEVSVCTTFDLPRDSEQFSLAKRSLDLFLNPPPDLHARVNRELIDQLIALNLLVPERIARTARVRATTVNPAIETPFTRRRFSLPPLPINADERLTSTPAVSIVSEDIELIWRKDQLPASDVQRQQGHPTGGVRLTQAGWRVGGNLIDQTSFFRNVLFGNWSWTVGENSPQERETTRVGFEVQILGRDYGVHQLVVSHKPEREAGQGNYTTMLHWGTLAEEIRSLNLVAKRLEVFRLNRNEEADFRIVIS